MFYSTLWILWFLWFLRAFFGNTNRASLIQRSSGSLCRNPKVSTEVGKNQSK